ncbi:hypothetical protein M5D96_013132, partial [Drosophila gunungcola]
YNEIHNRRVALGITCVQCTPVQLEILRRAGAMPVSSRRCGMITRREAERLCKSFLGDNTPPRLPDDFAFNVQHKYVQPDAANFNSWRRHMTLSGNTYDEKIIHAWEDVKAMFNGGTRKRLVGSSTNNRNQGSPTSSTAVSTGVSGTAAVVGVTAVAAATVGVPFNLHGSTVLSPLHSLRNERDLSIMPISRNFVVDYMWQQKDQHYQQQFSKKLSSGDASEPKKSISSALANSVSRNFDDNDDDDEVVDIETTEDEGKFMIQQADAPHSPADFVSESESTSHSQSTSTNIDVEADVEEAKGFNGHLKIITRRKKR